MKIQKKNLGQGGSGLGVRVDVNEELTFLGKFTKKKFGGGGGGGGGRVGGGQCWETSKKKNGGVVGLGVRV